MKNSVGAWCFQLPMSCFELSGGEHKILFTFCVLQCWDSHFNEHWLPSFCVFWSTKLALVPTLRESFVTTKLCHKSRFAAPFWRISLKNVTVLRSTNRTKKAWRPDRDVFFSQPTKLPWKPMDSFTGQLKQGFAFWRRICVPVLMQVSLVWVKLSLFFYLF